MSDFHHLLSKTITVELSGKKEIIGQLIDIGLDIIVVYTGQYYYIPIGHIQRVKLDLSNSIAFATDFQPEHPIALNSDTISFRKILTNAKGTFVSLYIEGNKMIHGYLTSIMNDYFVFHSPVHKVMFISMNHLKWLIPYQKTTSPYLLPTPFSPVQPTPIPLARTFTEQCKKCENQIVILDGGDHPEKIGLLQKVNDQTITLITAEQETIYWNCQHVKMLHLV